MPVRRAVGRARGRLQVKARGDLSRDSVTAVRGKGPDPPVPCPWHVRYSSAPGLWWAARQAWSSLLLWWVSCIRTAAGLVGLRCGHWCGRLLCPHSVRQCCVLTGLAFSGMGTFPKLARSDLRKGTPPMRRIRAAVVPAAVLSVGLVAGCGPAKSNASASSSTGSSAVSSSSSTVAGSSASSGSTDAAASCPTSNTRSFAKTRFAGDVGLAIGTFHRYLWKPYQAGSFNLNPPMS